MIPHKVVPAQKRYETGSYQEGDSDAEGFSFYSMGGEENKCGVQRILCDGYYHTSDNIRYVAIQYAKMVVMSHIRSIQNQPAILPDKS